MPATHVVVVDGASGDDSVAQLTRAIADEHWQQWVTFRPLEKNGGFAYGNNAAIREALAADDAPEYVLLLNPDTIVRPAALRSLVDWLDQHPKVGLLGSRLEDPDGTPQSSAFRFPSLLGELEDALRWGVATRVLSRWRVATPPSDEACRADWVAGASMLVRREVFEQIGLLDENYFMYYEEVDFCRRAANAGWACWYEPASRVVHLVGQASGVTDTKQRRRRPAYWFNSRRRYFLQHHGKLYTLATDATWALAYALWRCRRLVQRKEDRDPPRLLLDFVRHSALARGFQ